jgi:methylase of polypeptide subunit release factors
VGGEKGWELPLQILTQATDRLEPGGFLAMEIDPSQFPLLKEKAMAMGWSRVIGEKDYQDNSRFFIAFL